jgi:hypothetical protein
MIVVVDRVYRFNLDEDGFISEISEVEEYTHKSVLPFDVMEFDRYRCTSTIDEVYTWERISEEDYDARFPMTIQEDLIED